MAHGTGTDPVWPTLNNKNGVLVLYTVRQSLVNWPFLEVKWPFHCVERLKCPDCPLGPKQVVVAVRCPLVEVWLYSLKVLFTEVEVASHRH